VALLVAWLAKSMTSGPDEEMFGSKLSFYSSMRCSKKLLKTGDDPDSDFRAFSSPETAISNIIADADI
jgi:hypothetical protein